MLTQVLVPVVAILSASAVYWHAVSPSVETWEATANKMNTDVTWTEQGKVETFLFQRYGEEKSICIRPNTSWTFHVEPLTSKSQPHLMQLLGRLQEINQIYEKGAQYVKKLLGEETPLQAFLLLWTDLHIIVTSDSVSKLHLTYKTPPCKASNYIDSWDIFSTSFAQENIPDTLAWLLSVAGRHVRSWCRGCFDGCPLPCETVNGDAECRAILSPFDIPCVTVHGPVTGILLTSAKVPFTFSFHSVVSWTYVHNLLIGALLYLYAETLARSRWFHFTLGAFLGVISSIALLVYLAQKQTKSILRVLPGGRVLESFARFTTIVFPAASIVFMPMLKQGVHWVGELLLYVWIKENVYGVPHLGKLYILFFSLLGCLFVWWCQWWVPLPATDDYNKRDKNSISLDDDEDTNTVLEDIRRMEEEEGTLPKSQKLLSYCIKAVGLWVLTESTSSLSFSLGIIIAAWLSHILAGLYSDMYYWYWQETPGLYSHLISKETFVEEGKSETEKALAALRKYLQEHPDATYAVREQHEIRLRRFVHGRNHMETHLQRSPRKESASYHRSVDSLRWCCML